jgi:hypothetical protein
VAAINALHQQSPWYLSLKSLFFERAILLVPDSRILPDHAAIDAGFHGQASEFFGRDGRLEVGKSLRAKQRLLLPVLCQKLLCCNG